MQDHIPDALITAFERQYDASWNDPQLRNERLAMRYGWAAAMEAKPCLHQIQEPASNHSEIPSSSEMSNNCAAAVAVPDEREAFGIPQCPFPCGWKNLHTLLVAEGAFLARSLQEDEPITEPQRATVMRVVNYGLKMARAALAATPAEKSNSAEFDGIKTAAPVMLPEPDGGETLQQWALRVVEQNPKDSMDSELALKACAERITELESLLATGGQAQAEVSSALKPCPFCGGAAHFDVDEDNWEWVECSNCGMQGNCSASLMEDCKPKLIEAWNRRTPTPQAQADARDADGMYYLQDARHSAMVGNCPSWWRPDGNGYTTNLDEAARFTFDEAMAQHRCRDTDLPWLCSEVDKLRRPTVDCQYMPRSWDAQRESIAAIAAAKGK